MIEFKGWSAGKSKIWVPWKTTIFPVNCLSPNWRHSTATGSKLRWTESFPHKKLQVQRRIKKWNTLPCPIPSKRQLNHMKRPLKRLQSILKPKAIGKCITNNFLLFLTIPLPLDDWIWSWKKNLAQRFGKKTLYSKSESLRHSRIQTRSLRVKSKKLTRNASSLRWTRLTHSYPCSQKLANVAIKMSI